MRHSQDSGKDQRETGKDRADQGQKGQTAGQGRSDRDDARRSEDRTPDKGKADSKQQAQQPSRQNQSGSGARDQSAQDRNPNSGSGQNVTHGQTAAPAQGQATAPPQSQTAPAQGQAAAPVQGQTTATSQSQTRTNLTAQQQTTLQQSVLRASNAPRINANSINFQVHAGVALPSNISVVSVSTYPALIDVFPAYRDYSFFVVEDEVVFVDRDRRIVDVVPAGPRTRFSGGRGGQGSSASVATVDLPPDDIRVVQRVLIERGLLRGEADGVLGTQTREAISVFQRQQGIQVTGSIDAGTVSSLGVSGRLSQQANQSIGLSQSSTTGAQTSTSGQGQAGTGQTQTGQQRPSQQQNATGLAPNQSTGQAASTPAQQNQPSTTTGQSTAPNQPTTTGQASPQTQSGNQPTVNQNPPAGQVQGAGSPPSQPAQSSASSR
jgi:hypothetical protein